MKAVRVLIVFFGIVALFGFADAKEKKGMKAKDMPVEKQIRLAMSAAPSDISKDATIMVFGKDGKLMETRKGTNGFTCVPDVDDQEIPDPFCGDAAAMQWANDYMSKAPRPTNTSPGIAYMGKGGWHWEKDGKVVMSSAEPGAKRVKEPPHWMIFWPFDSEMTGLPSAPDKFGAYIMFEDTPYAHLMIYQDPNQLGKKGMMKKQGMTKEMKGMHEKHEKREMMEKEK